MRLRKHSINLFSENLLLKLILIIKDSQSLNLKSKIRKLVSHLLPCFYHNLLTLIYQENILKNFYIHDLIIRNRNFLHNIRRLLNWFLDGYQNRIGSKNIFNFRFLFLFNTLKLLFKNVLCRLGLISELQLIIIILGKDLVLNVLVINNILLNCYH